MREITIFVTGSWDRPQQTYPFKYRSLDRKVKITDSSIEIRYRGPCKLVFDLQAEVGGHRLSWAKPPMVWKDDKAPPDKSSWIHLRLADDHQIFVLTDPNDHTVKSGFKSGFSCYVQVDDGSGTVKQSTDPTLINKPDPDDPSGY